MIIHCKAANTADCKISCEFTEMQSIGKDSKAKENKKGVKMCCSGFPAKGGKGQVFLSLEMCLIQP